MGRSQSPISKGSPAQLSCRRPLGAQAVAPGHDQLGPAVRHNDAKVALRQPHPALEHPEVVDPGGQRGRRSKGVQLHGRGSHGGTRRHRTITAARPKDKNSRRERAGHEAGAQHPI